MFGKKANFVLFSIIAMLFFCVTTSYAGMAPKVFITKGVIKGGHSYAAGGLSDQFLHRWADIVAKKTNGDIKIEIYPAGQLGGYRETFELVQMGTVQFVWEGPSCVQPWDNELPGVAAALFMLRDEDHFYKVWQGPLGKELMDEIAYRTGFREIFGVSRGFRMLATTKPVYNVEDLKKVKLRFPQMEAWLRYWKSMGANVTPISFVECFSSMQTGIIDGLDQEFPTMYENGFFDVAKYAVMTWHSVCSYGPIFGETYWRKLHPEIRDILIEAGKEATPWMQEQVRDLEAKYLDLIQKKGVKVIDETNGLDVESFREAAKNIKFTTIESYYYNKIRNLK